ncbi:hypothetical protein [Bradyrhizobium sp. UFLA05-109]
MSALRSGIWRRLSAVQGTHDANPREHRRAALLGHQDQGFHRRLPFRGIMHGLGQRGDVFAGVTAAFSLRQWDISVQDAADVDPGEHCHQDVRDKHQ